MSKINAEMWKEFRVGDLFSQERGKEKAPKQNQDGDCPLVQEKSINNGIDRNVTPTRIFKGNAITISINHAQTVFYQENDFCASVNIAILRNDKINAYSGRFICAILSAAHKKYNYIDKISKDIINDEIIKLPVDGNGNPDWDYMERYMKDIEVRVCDRISKLESVKNVKKIKIDVSNWTRFKVGDLFDIHPTKHYNGPDGKALSNSHLFDDDGKNPVVVNSAYNNGIGGHTNKPCNEKGGIITFSDTTTASAIFYQPNDFVGYSHVQGMYPHGIYAEKWSMYSMRFFESVFKSRAKDLGYDYVNKFERDLAKEIIVSLPVDNNGDPDFKYMEQYMKNIEQEASQRLDSLLMANCDNSSITGIHFAAGTANSGNHNHQKPKAQDTYKGRKETRDD